jgi:hypothetical protein
MVFTFPKLHLTEYIMLIMPEFINGHLEKLLVNDKSHAKHDKTYLFVKGLFSGLVGIGEKYKFFEVLLSRLSQI